MRSRMVDPWGRGPSATKGKTAREGKTWGDRDRVRPCSIRTHGSSITKKSDKIFRLFYENFNSLNDSWKTTRLVSLQRALGLDLVCGTELNRKLSTAGAQTMAEKIFQHTPCVRGTSSHNRHENFGRKQRGGVLMATGGELSEHTTLSGGNDAGLGRWMWIVLGSGDHKTRILTAYQPCRSRKEGYTTSYNQQRHHWRSCGILTCPRRLFREHLLEALKGWHSQGDRLIVFMDGNKDMNKGYLQGALSTELDMYDVVSGVGGLHHCYAQEGHETN